VLNKASLHEDVRGRGCITPGIFKLYTKWKGLANFTHRPSYSRGKSYWYLLVRELGHIELKSSLQGLDELQWNGVRTEVHEDVSVNW
jgi:hypothetical protein